MAAGETVLWNRPAQRFYVRFPSDADADLAETCLNVAGRVQSSFRLPLPRADRRSFVLDWDGDGAGSTQFNAYQWVKRRVKKASAPARALERFLHRLYRDMFRAMFSRFLRHL